MKVEAFSRLGSGESYLPFCLKLVNVHHTNMIFRLGDDWSFENVLVALCLKPLVVARMTGQLLLA